MTPTLAPASYASMAARIPAQPAPTTKTSCVDSTSTDATETTRRAASLEIWSGGAHRLADVAEALGEVVGEPLRELARLAVVFLGIAPGRARIEDPGVDAVHGGRNVEPEQLVRAELHFVELA